MANANSRNLSIMSAQIDLSGDTSTTVYDGAAVLLGVYVSTTIGTGAVTIDDDATAKITLPVSLPVGSYDFYGALFGTKLVVNPADNSTGTIIVFYRPL